MPRGGTSNRRTRITQPGELPITYTGRQRREESCVDIHPVGSFTTIRKSRHVTCDVMVDVIHSNAFRLVCGCADNLLLTREDSLIGLHRHTPGSEALDRVAQVSLFGRSSVAATLSLDEVVIQFGSDNRN